jgi:hypothetical protein
VMDQVLTYILSAVGILGFFLAGKKVWWAWYVNIANQLIWLFFSVITQQWGFLIATLFYFVVFSKNAYHWTKEHVRAKGLSNLADVFDEKVVPVRSKRRHSTMGMRWGYMKPEMAQQPASVRITPEVRPASDIPKPPGEISGDTIASADRHNQMVKFMRVEGTDPAVANEIAFVVTDVLRASKGDDYYVDFSERYSIAHEVQRRLDVKLKGTRPDEKIEIKKAIDSIDEATQDPMFDIRPDLHKMAYALGTSKRVFLKLLKGK